MGKRDDTDTTGLLWSKSRWSGSDSKRRKDRKQQSALVVEGWSRCG